MPAVRNVAREKLEAGHLALGVGIRMTRSVEIAKAMAVAGFDWLFLDMEHGVMSLEACAQISTAARLVNPDVHRAACRPLAEIRLTRSHMDPTSADPCPHQSRARLRGSTRDPPFARRGTTVTDGGRRPLAYAPPASGSEFAPSGALMGCAKCEREARGRRGPRAHGRFGDGATRGCFRWRRASGAGGVNRRSDRQRRSALTLPSVALRSHGSKRRGRLVRC